MGSAAGIAVVKAVESGMNVRIIGEQVRNEWQLVTPVSFKDPKQLDGKGSVIMRRLRSPRRWSNGWRFITRYTQLDDHSRLGHKSRSASCAASWTPLRRRSAMF